MVAATSGHGPAVVSSLQFYKMTGSGNDFVVLDGRSTAPEHWTAAEVRAMCDRRNGVGADGLVILTPVDAGVVGMRYWNSDGSRGAMCGNAALCSGRLAVALEMASPGEFCLLTDSGAVRVRTLVQSDRAEINLPDFPVPVDQPLQLTHLQGERWMSFLTVGVPHLVVRVDDLQQVDVASRGRALRFDPALGPEGANVNFISPAQDPEAPWGIRTYERGVEGETLACGTGTVAAAMVLASRGEAQLPLVLRSRGGLSLTVRGDLRDSSASNVWLGGEGRLVFRGLWESRSLLRDNQLPT
jgi:diaminopimelate epimerase